MPADPRRVKDLFIAALDRSDEPVRRAFLDRECRDDPELRGRLEALLAAHDRPLSALERPIVDDLGTRSFTPDGARGIDGYPTQDGIGVVIAGRYKRLELIGEGGMGQVWVADQLAPIRRRVALKLIKPGMDSRAVLARFEAERQALALMDHPNIARVLDAGADDDGRPFFVMELVKGVPITDFCDARRLTPRERLALFVPVCQAVQHAHQKGIIHRDIKPSNVLVALHDESPVPKVIDFGVAKAVGQPLTESTLYTGFGALIGTPTYMAPEQATFNQLDIDTRADVYALGVLLYELLAGSPPFEPERLRQVALDEVLRLVREEEPPRPSARLSSSETRASIAAIRQSDPARLASLFRGELDWIVMKALEKDRNRRYDTATDLASDVRRYLDGEPVLAHPPGAAYRLRKFAHRHRLALATASAFVALLIASVVLSGWLAVQARRSEADAVAARRRVERTAAGLRVDAGLQGMKSDRRLGLLRLIQTLRELPADERELRQFLTAAVLYGGQGDAPLLPPIPDRGHVRLSPDGRTVLTLGPDAIARLRDTRSYRPLAVLRRGTERVVNCGYSPDGRTVFTDDQASVARLWDAADGRFRAEIEPRPNRYDTPRALTPGRTGAPVSGTIFVSWPLDMVLLGNRRMLTHGYRETPTEPGVVEVRHVGPVELWDTATGRLIARLGEPDQEPASFDFLGRTPPMPNRAHVDPLGGERWITTRDWGATAPIYSAEDGRLVARLTHPGKTLFTDPTGGRVGTVSTGGLDTPQLRIWDADSGWVEAVRTPIDLRHEPSWWAGQMLGCYESTDVVIPMTVYRIGRREPVAEYGDQEAQLLLPGGALVQLNGGKVYETATGRRLMPPPGRKFAPDLARFAIDGRFVRGTAEVGERNVIDTVTEKSFPVDGGEFAHLPGLGIIRLDSGSMIRLIPESDKLDIPTDLLELWLQVALCGAIGPDGFFVQWDEPTWDRKRRDLAARPAPRPGVPFPGFVAQDPLHWLRLEFRATGATPERLRVATTLLARAEAMGDPAEIARWRDERDRLEAELAPKPPEEK